MTTTPKTSPKTRTRMVVNHNTPDDLWLGLSDSACLCPLSPVCLLRPVAHVCTPISLGFPFHADNHWPRCITACLPLSPKAYIPLNRSPLKSILTMYSCCFYVNQSGSLLMPLRDFGNVMWISDNAQWKAENNGLPGLSGCRGSSFCWNPLFFPHSNLVSFKHILALFPRGFRLSSKTLL
jgi:hypothetical protein